MVKTTVTFEFETKEIAEVFVQWFCNIGEQEYWHEEECDRPVANNFNYDWTALKVTGVTLDED